MKPYKDQYNEKKALVDEKSQEYALAEREANRQLGLFSAHGVQRTRDHFWYACFLILFCLLKDVFFVY